MVAYLTKLNVHNTLFNLIKTFLFHVLNNELKIKRKSHPYSTSSFLSLFQSCITWRLVFASSHPLSSAMKTSTINHPPHYRLEGVEDYIAPPITAQFCRPLRQYATICRHRSGLSHQTHPTSSPSLFSSVTTGHLTGNCFVCGKKFYSVF